MKKYFILIIVLLLAGCGASQQSSGDAKSEHQVKKKSETVTADKSNKKNEKAEKDKESKNEKKAEADAKKVEPKYEVDPKTWTVQPINSEDNEKVVLLTIDDAPDKHAEEMAKTLKSLNVGAIFFVNGHFLTDNEDKKQVVKNISDMGFLIGDHTYSHADLTTLSEPEQKKEIMSVYDQIKEITGKPTHFFRAPFGKNTDLSHQLAEENSMTLMNWSYGYDWNKEYENPKALTDIMLNTPLLSGGSILLMHDRDWTNKALKDIVTGLQKKGYTMLDPHLIKTQQ